MERFFKVSQTLCKNCGVCIEVCPKNVIGRDKEGKVRILRIEDCIQCSGCVMICPDYAIFTDEEKFKQFEK